MFLFRWKKVLTQVSIRVSMLVFGQIQVELSTILGYHYRALTRLRLQSFGIHLDNEAQVGTLLRWYLSQRQSIYSRNALRMIPNFSQMFRKWSQSCLSVFSALTNSSVFCFPNLFFFPFALLIVRGPIQLFHRFWNLLMKLF